MIKSTAVGEAKELHKYPRLMISKNEGNLIILFTHASTGTVIASDRTDGFNPVGEHSECWHMPSFEPWSGKVVIEQD